MFTLYIFRGLSKRRGTTATRTPRISCGRTAGRASGTRGALEGDGGAKRTVVVRAAEGVNEARVDCVVYFCRTDDVCLMQRVRFEVPVATGGASETTAEYVVAAEANDAAVPSFD